MKSAIVFQNQPAIEMTDGPDRVIVAPDHGARILRWEHDGREIIRWPEDADWNNILKVRGGNPILFPFIARHFVDGQPERWRDAAGVIRPMPQHGFARDAKFAVIGAESDDANELRLRLTDSAQTRALYPFSFQFDVVIVLRAKSLLEIRFETTNLGTKPLPYYAGYHFYFAIPHPERADWQLDLPCESWGHQEPDGSIQREAPGNNVLRLDGATLIDRFQIGPTQDEICLYNQRTHQRLIFELQHGGAIPWYAVTTWTQAPTSDFYCIEPWLGLPNAIHHGEGLRRLAPGQTETATCIIKADEWSAPK